VDQTIGLAYREKSFLALAVEASKLARVIDRFSLTDLSCRRLTVHTCKSGRLNHISPDSTSRDTLRKLEHTHLGRNKELLMSALSSIQQSMKGSWTTLTCSFSQVPSTMLPKVQESLTCLFSQAFMLSRNDAKPSAAPIAKTELVQAKSANTTCLVGVCETGLGCVWESVIRF
jgi:hypothetical protein